MQDQDIRPKRVCSPKYAVMKARKGKTLNRWELEDLAKDPEQSFLYAVKVLRGRFHQGETAIANSDCAYEYAVKVIDGRFPEAEPYFISQLDGWGHGNKALHYFVHIAKVRHPKVEESILERHQNFIVEYAKNCVGGRWHEAEKEVIKCVTYADAYHKEVLKGRWPEWEDRILGKKKLGYFDNRTQMLSDYLKVVPAPVPGLEEKLEKCNRASLILAYAVSGIRGRLPNALHQKMMMFSFDPKRQKTVRKYLKFLESCERRAIRYLSGLDEDELKEILAKARTK
jgi:hypothetical protein